MGSWLYELIQNFFEDGNFELMMLQNNGLIEVSAYWFCAILNKYIYNYYPDGVVALRVNSKIFLKTGISN